MNQENYLKIYEFLVQAMRYWFTLLSVLIVYITAKNVFRDYRLRKRLNEDETVGELRVMSGGGETLAKNTIWEFTHEAMIGSSRNCDVPVSHESVLAQHVLMKVEGDHVLLRLIDKEAPVRINNKPYEFGTYDLAYSGDRLKIGEVVLELWLFGEKDIIEEDFAEEDLPKPKRKKPKKISLLAKLTSKKPAGKAKTAASTKRAKTAPKTGIKKTEKSLQTASRTGTRSTRSGKSTRIVIKNDEEE